MATNRSMPPGIIIPELVYPDLDSAADWLCAVLGFTKRLQIGNHRIQLVLGGTTIVAIRAQDGQIQFSADHSLMVRVADVDQHYEHSRQNGVKIISTPADYPYGERQYSLQDPGGHVWTFSQSIEDVDPPDWGGRLINPK
ncbi:MAG TPA: VOC family protein [Bellilinea sp.]